MFFVLLENDYKLIRKAFRVLFSILSRSIRAKQDKTLLKVAFSKANFNEVVKSKILDDFEKSSVCKACES